MAVLEMGMNHPGETGYLAGIAGPTMAVVNNAQREHQEFMKSVEEVAAEHAAVFARSRNDGVAVINADDAYFGLLGRHRGQAPRCARSAPARRPTSAPRTGSRPATSEIEIAADGARAAARCRCRACTTCGTRSLRPPPRSPPARSAGGRARPGGVPRREGPPAAQARAATARCVIDDTYNANPDSVRAAIDVLAASARRRGAGAGRHGRGRRRRAERSTPRSAATRKTPASTGCSRWAARGARRRAPSAPAASTSTASRR